MGKGACSLMGDANGYINRYILCGVIAVPVLNGISIYLMCTNDVLSIISKSMGLTFIYPGVKVHNHDTLRLKDGVCGIFILMLVEAREEPSLSSWWEGGGAEWGNEEAMKGGGGKAEHWLVSTAK